jgi:hypothetical protein
MTRKHYVEMAHVLNIRLRIDAETHRERGLVLLIARDFADLAKADNSRFDRDRFMAAVTKGTDQ